MNFAAHSYVPILDDPLEPPAAIRPVGTIYCGLLPGYCRSCNLKTVVFSNVPWPEASIMQLHKWQDATESALLCTNWHYRVKYCTCYLQLVAVGLIWEGVILRVLAGHAAEPQVYSILWCIFNIASFQTLPGRFLVLPIMITSTVFGKHLAKS